MSGAISYFFFGLTQEYNVEEKVKKKQEIIYCPFLFERSLIA